MTRTALQDGVDLTAAEALLELPIAIPVRPVNSLEYPGDGPIPDRPGSGADSEALAVLASFDESPATFGINYDLARCGEEDLNEMLLHELVHVRQWFDDPLGFAARFNRELADFGYWDTPYEIDARQRAREMEEAGVRVYFPKSARRRRRHVGAATGGATGQSGGGRVDDQLRRAKADLEQSVAELDRRIAELLARDGSDGSR